MLIMFLYFIPLKILYFCEFSLVSLKNPVGFGFL